MSPAVRYAFSVSSLIQTNSYTMLANDGFFLQRIFSILMFSKNSLAVEFTVPAGSFSEITAGQPFTLTWSDAVGAVTLTLQDEPVSDLKAVGIIQCKYSNLANLAKTNQLTFWYYVC